MHFSLKILFIKIIKQKYGLSLQDAKDLTEMWAVREVKRNHFLDVEYDERLKELQKMVTRG